MVPLKYRIMNFGVIIHILLTSLKHSKVIILVINVLLLSRNQKEQKFTAFNAIYGLSVLTLRAF